MNKYITTKNIIIKKGTVFAAGAKKISRCVPFIETWIGLHPDNAICISMPEEETALLPKHFKKVKSSPCACKVIKEKRK